MTVFKERNALWKARKEGPGQLFSGLGRTVLKAPGGFVLVSKEKDSFLRRVVTVFEERNGSM